MNNNLLTVKWYRICTYLHTTVNTIDYQFKSAQKLTQTMRGNVSQIIWFKCLRYHMFFLRAVCNVTRVIIIVSLRLKTHDDTFRHISVCKFHSSCHSQIDALSLCSLSASLQWKMMEKYLCIKARKQQTYSTNNTFSIIAKLVVVEVSATDKIEKNRKVIISASITSLFQHC